MKDHPSKYDQARAMREARYAGPPREEVVPAGSDAARPIVAPPPVVRAKADRSGAVPVPAKPIKRWQMYATIGQCEHCDRNRAKALERVKRYREIRKAIERGGE